ncbi:hypothetical protein ACFWMG_05090 [Streptomyces sp. NPDC127074]|uniref:hypothetical protein n=1 Tax=Streptomyces sp. NPDC127074 TaxID=3347130 RepID=UPI0036587020
MTDHPYTDDDLRAEAARQHKTLTEDPDFMGVGEQMEDSPIESTTALVDAPVGPTWGEALTEDGYDAAQRKIHDLITSAADVSDWAISLGADGLEPDDHTIQLAVGDRTDSADEPTVRMHFAFHPDMEAADRDQFVVALSKVVLRNL